LGELLLTLPTDEVISDEGAKLDPNWRLESRNDRTPPGFAIMKRGKKKEYIGYVGYYSPKKEQFPTYQELTEY